jgi:large subunit ribosomal protein L21
MYAIIEDSGTQFRVEKGQELDVDCREAQAGDTLTFERVLLVADEKGIRIGRPVVEGAKVTAEVVGDVKGPKLEVFKLRRRKSSRRHTGHRQPYLRVRVTEINA